MNFYAHSAKLKNTNDGFPNPNKSSWEPLFTPFGIVDTVNPRAACSGFQGEHDPNHPCCPHCESLHPQHGHLNKVAYLCAKFASEMFPLDHTDHTTIQQWAYLTGLWHDLGKFSLDWQRYLDSKADPHQGELTGKVDHSTAGAKHITEKNPLGHLIANAIAGHHSGLLDTRHPSHTSLEKRLQKTYGKDIPELTLPEGLSNYPIPPLPTFLPQGKTSKELGYSLAFFQRMLFSSLVDADFLATESFMNRQKTTHRPDTPKEIFEKALDLLERKISSFGQPRDIISEARATVLHDCKEASTRPSGIFTLTVPTGGGKTLSSLNFSLRHLLKHKKQRIIYVIPFTSIIEQNAAVFRDILAPLGEHIIIEHHSNLSPEQESETSRLASENWDAPIIVTTALQFYESLHAAKTSRSRKLHNIANSVIILDEAQCLPLEYLAPSLRCLEELSTKYNSSIVLCTATQPAVAKNSEFIIGFSEAPSEIIQDIASLFSALSRVYVTYRGLMEDSTIAKELADSDQALCIVNTRKHAQRIFELLPVSSENFHLSTLMCPKHRIHVFREIRHRLKEGLPVRLISTQLIEAGVDIDFPLVYRSMAGLDSIAQAAGRCNREGKLEGKGHTHIFHSEHTASERHFAQTANVGHQILNLHPEDPLSTEAIHQFFHIYYYQQKDLWDQKGILSHFEYTGANDLPLLSAYRTVAENFKLIENKQKTILIPWDEQGKTLCKILRKNHEPLHRGLLRKLQQYTVQIYENEFYNNNTQFEAVRDAQFHILICPETHYSKDHGLHFSHTNSFLCPS